MKDYQEAAQQRKIYTAFLTLLGYIWDATEEETFCIILFPKVGKRSHNPAEYISRVQDDGTTAIHDIKN